MSVLRRRFAARVIRTASLFVAVFAVLGTLLDPRPLLLAESPVAAFDGDDEPLVLFASLARHAVLPGSSYTVSATSSREELLLWRAMLAYSARREPVHPDDPRADSARFIISYGSMEPPQRGLRYVVSFGRGVVWERPS